MPRVPSHKQQLFAVIYARYSSDSQRDASIEDQLRECHKWADDHGVKVIHEYCDYAIINEIECCSIWGLEPRTADGKLDAAVIRRCELTLCDADPFGEVSDVRHCKLRCRRGCGCTAVGDRIRNGRIRFVSDCRNNGNLASGSRRSRDGTRCRFGGLPRVALEHVVHEYLVEQGDSERNAC